jgi:hypothetical protein
MRSFARVGTERGRRASRAGLPAVAWRRAVDLLRVVERVLYVGNETRAHRGAWGW